MRDAVNHSRAEVLIRQDGVVLAGAAMERALGDPRVALAIMGVAVAAILDPLEAPDRSAMLRHFLDSFNAEA